MKEYHIKEHVLRLSACYEHRAEGEMCASVLFVIIAFVIAL